MKRRTKILSVLLVLSVWMSLFAALPITASSSAPGSESVSYKQKIVAVVYDNSGSMINGTGNIREPAARYSLEILMSLMDERDEMFIIPMNDAEAQTAVTNPDQRIDVSLSASDRNAELDRVMSNPKLKAKNGLATPAGSMEVAVKELVNRGLKDSNNLLDADPTKEFWLVILTDGTFDAYKNYGTQAGKIEHNIKQYPTLHSIYVGFGSGSVDLTDDKTLQAYPFTAYAATEDKLATVIQQISNQMSGRYPLSEKQYTVGGNQNVVTVNLNSLNFSLSSLSLIAQNCGATLTKATYNGSVIGTAKECVFEPDGRLGLASGFSCELPGDPYFQGGELVLEFSGPVDAKRLSIFAEPALNISYYFECLVNNSWQRVDAQYINANLFPSDKIRMGYEVLDQVKQTPIDLEKEFGDVSSKILYNQTVYQAGEDIPLIVGSHDISIEVSVMQGAYTLRGSETLTIEENPSYYRIESEGDTQITVGATNAKAIFTVYVDNKPATPAVLQDYTYTVTATTSAGDPAEVTATMGSDGKITATLTVPESQFDLYTIEITVTSPKKLSRSATHGVTYFPESLDLAIDGQDHLSITQYDLESNENGFTFALTTGGKPFPIQNGMTEFTLFVDGIDVSEYAIVKGNTLTFVPTAENLGSAVDQPGDKEVLLTIKSKSHPQLDTSAKAKLTVIKTVYTVVSVDGGNPSVDRFDLANSDAVLYFAVLRDGVSITEEELKEAYEKGDLQLSGDFVFNAFFLPASLESSIEVLDGTPVLAVRVARDMNTYFDWHYSAFIFGSEKGITVTYCGIEAQDNFLFEESSLFTHLIRIFLLLFVHALIIYTVIYIIGFFKAKALPTGVFIQISEYGTSVTPVNDTFWKRYGWHLIRFVTPWKVWAYQSLQSQAPDCSGIEFGYDKRYPFAIHFQTEDGNTYPVGIANSQAINVLEAYYQNVADNYDFDSSVQSALASARITLPVTRLFRIEDAALRAESIGEMSSKTYYGRYIYDQVDRKKKFMYAVCFFQF